LLCLGLVVVTAAFAACGDDDDGGSEADKTEVTDTVLQVAAASGQDADQTQFWLDHVTDNFIEIFYPEGRAACEENAVECIGDPLTNPTVDEETIDLGSDSGTVTVHSDELSSVVDVVKADDVWKLDELHAANDEIADGTEKVDLKLDEFSFTFDAESDAVKSGEFAFAVSNDGEQTHEVAVAKVPDDMSIDDFLQSDDPEAAGAEFITFKFPYAPGDEADMAVPKLEAGRYLMMCFLPDAEDPEHAPHAAQGMSAEFTVE
jgi:uncharacterized cupredoxin-like copper-binding protein